jgi:hypothetical protein
MSDAYLPACAYRVGGPRERIVWNGEQLVWVTEYAPAPSRVEDDNGLLPEFSFRGRP